jgi:hypothetical protein
MHTLLIGPGWASQIAAVRDANTEDTNLIRFGNTFYRSCPAEPHRFEVQLQAGNGPARRLLTLTLQAGDFSVVDVAGEPLPQAADAEPLQALVTAGLGDAVQRLAGGAAPPPERPGLRMLLAFCVAESIRSDHLANALELRLRSPAPPPADTPAALPLQAWWALAQQWGEASDAIYAALSPAAREIAGQPRSRLSPQQRHFSEYVDVARLPAHLQRCAQTTKVLRRPA